MAAKREIYVYAHWEGIQNPTLMGILQSERLKGKEIFSFQYNEEWLRSDEARVLDPDLQLYSGSHYLGDDKKINFGMFTDSSPDRWGRILMQRREAALARKEERKGQNLFETDYLLGVFDGHRMGALRFKEDMDGPFLNDNAEMASPPWASLRELERISLQLEKEDVVD
ncbi:MAG: HipA N-terminal domain-containing protein, partial [Flavobacteriales bacterium]|nr:HipA N-terminal domain-containing protein [Flavobacteriales bacterium]